jgi:hypothetical protein
VLLDTDPASDSANRSALRRILMKQATVAASLALAFAFPALAHADGSAPAPSLGAVIAATPGLSLTGYLASTYTHFDTTPALRQFDTTQNGFTFNQASLTASYLPSSGFGGSVTLLGGSDATYLPGGTQMGVANAFVQYAQGNLTVMAGRLPTLAGMEVVSPLGNNEISRSLLFTTLEPIYHTGLRAAYAANGALTVTAGVNEGYNHATQVPGTSKTVELGASGSPTKMFSYSAALYYTGTGTAYTSAPGKEQLIDLVGNINATDALNFGLNIDLVSKDSYNGLGSGTGKADGYALYANYAINDQFTLSGRGEYLDDKQGIVTSLAGGTLGTANKLKELTLALNYTPVKNVKLAAELRQDKSDQSVFDGATKSKQTSIELLAAYSF